VPGVVEVFHARMTAYAYPRHAHDHWTVLIVDAGGIGYGLDTRAAEVPTRSTSVLPPHVVHDGHPLRASFHKRVLALDATWLPDDLIGAAVDHSCLDDPALYRTLAAAHDALVRGDHLDAETRIATAAETIRTSLRPTTVVRGAEPRMAMRLRQFLDEHAFESLTLVDAARALDRNPTHLARSFAAAFGMTPHGYVTARRVDAARRLLLDGVRAAEVAAAVGFHDQAHLTRHFRRHTSSTPARFAHSGPRRR
jgi:AraC-like DNA-binding protein